MKEKKNQHIPIKIYLQHFIFIYDIIIRVKISKIVLFLDSLYDKESYDL